MEGAVLRYMFHVDSSLHGVWLATACIRHLAFFVFFVLRMSVSVEIER
jgi:hypothetical protein